MNTRKECIDIVRSIIGLKKNNFVVTEGDNLSFLSSVDMNTGSIQFPILQEAMLILYEIDEGERVLLFYLALLMLENDDYDLCKDLLNQLEEKGMPSCQDSNALYESILFKQLFILLHECGHYYAAKNKELKDYINEILDEIRDDFFISSSLDKDYIDKVINKIDEVCPQVTDLNRNLIEDTDIFFKTKHYMSNPINRDESASDIFALMGLYHYSKDNKKHKITKATKKSIFEAPFIVAGLINFAKSLEIQGDKGHDDYYKMISDAHSDFNVNGLRFTLLGIFIDDLYSNIPLAKEEVGINMMLKLIYSLSKDSTRWERYLDAWILGNTNPTNITLREELVQRIMIYSNSLFELYKKNEETWFGRLIKCRMFILARKLIVWKK